MILLIDIGNTNTKFKLSDSEEIISIQTSAGYLADNFDMLLPQSFHQKIDGCIISSVVPKANIPIIQYIKENYSVNPLVVSSSFLSMIVYPNGVHNELGADIVANLESAALESKNFILIDCGTATTISLVKDNKFIGCVIAPGIVTSQRSLVQSAAMINYVDMNGPYMLVSLLTDQCVRSGIINGFSYLLDGFINDIRTTYRMNNCDIFLTGGASRFVIDKLKNKVKYEENMIFKGLRHLYLTNRAQN